MQIEVTGEVILDTIEDTIMSGARGQTIFDKGKAARSAVHTGWWSKHCARETARKAGYNFLVDSLERITKDYNNELKRVNNKYSDVNPNLIKSYKDVNRDFQYLFSCINPNQIFSKSMPFKNNTRYVVKEIKSVFL